MLPTILQHSAGLIAFITLLNPALYQPQIRHLLNLVEAILVCNGGKTLSNLYRQIRVITTLSFLCIPTSACRHKKL
jgi:hypothetical protein